MGVVIFRVKLELDVSVNGLRSSGTLDSLCSPSETTDMEQLITLQNVFKNLGLYAKLGVRLPKCKSLGNKKTSNK